MAVSGLGAAAGTNGGRKINPEAHGIPGGVCRLYLRRKTAGINPRNETHHLAMVDHISDTQMEAFCAHALVDSHLAELAGHIAACVVCRQRFQESLISRRGRDSASISLSPTEWFRNDHLEDEQLDALVEERLDAEERRIVDLHLEGCADCRAEAQSLRAFIEGPEFERSMRYRSAAEKTAAGWRLPALRWKWAYGGAALLVVILAILAALVLARREAKRPPAQVAESPSPSVPITPAPEEEKLASLKDGERLIRFSGAEIVSGLEGFPARLRPSISAALLAGTLSRPSVLNDLASGKGALKGDPEKTIALKLVSPARSVLVDDLPLFRWTPMEAANSYRVQVADLQGNEVASSGQLSSDITQWRPPTPLKRGAVYTWVVIATVDGEEITAPAPAEAEMRFRVLEREKADELAGLRKPPPSHLALGVFYAREGMLSDAEREFQLLVKENPNSPAAAKLLRLVQSWR